LFYRCFVLRSNEAKDSTPGAQSNAMISGRLEEKYELLERLGHGNFGEVYRIRELATGHTRALKRIRTGSDCEKMELIPAAAFNEIQAMQLLSHPNVHYQDSMIIHTIL
jgi:serine/threonine protein kinase